MVRSHFGPSGIDESEFTDCIASASLADALRLLRQRGPWQHDLSERLGVKRSYFHENFALFA